jgi:hypothetical protein
MLTTLIGLILIVLVLIWRDIDSQIRDHASLVKAASEETNKYLGQMVGEIGRMHRTILELWACPTCHGLGVTDLENSAEDPRYPFGKSVQCEACKGTGMKPAGTKQARAEVAGHEKATD